MNPQPEPANMYIVLPDSKWQRRKSTSMPSSFLALHIPGSIVGGTMPIRTIAQCKGTEARVSLASENNEKPRAARMEVENKFEQFNSCTPQ